MKVNVVAVGGIKESFFEDAIKEYSKRLSRFCELKISEVDEATKYKNSAIKSEKEGKELLPLVKGYVIALDMGGKRLNSEEFANLIHGNMVNGVNEITFVIGGSNGLSKEVKSRVDFILSFGSITFPHQLFRVVLLEQVYRAFTIINGMPYHK